MHRLATFRFPDFLRLSELRRSGLRLPRPRPPALRLWPEIDLDDPRRFTEPLRFFFYVTIFVALLAILTGATATGVVILIAAAALHVVRSSLEELAAQRRARRERAARPRQVRLRSHRAARKPREEIRITTAQPRASSARKQRVI